MASMSIRMRVNDSQNIVVGQTDYIALERTYDVSAAELGAKMRVEWLAYLAWNRLRKQGDTTLPFEAWLDTDPNIEIVDDEAAESGNGEAPQG